MNYEDRGPDRSFVFETDDEENDADEGAIEGDYDSDSSLTHSDYRLRSYDWPQSYRQSIDILSSVTPPSVGFLAPSLSRIGSSFWSTSTHRRTSNHDIEYPFLAASPAQEDWRSQPKSSALKLSQHELIISQNCSYAQALINGVNILCGVGLLSTPYAVKEGGWLGLLILFGFSVISCYTGILLKRCLESKPGVQTYPDIGQAAFGKAGRLGIAIILYAELYACCVEYIILISDNLTFLFPNAHLSFLPFSLNSNQLFAVATTLAVLPTVWLRNLSLLSYLSAGGVIASIVVVICLFWVGVVDGVGFHEGGTPLDLQNLPVALGLYGFCYSGHAIYPNIYSSMKKPAQFPAVLVASFSICTVLYAGVAIAGFLMFGNSTESQFTLNLPKKFVASKTAAWTTVVNPLTKYALTITPVALSLEELLPSKSSKSHLMPVFIRTILVLSTLVVALSIPFFGFVMAFIGSFLTMIIALIFPCASYLSIVRGRITSLQVAICVLIIMVGVACACVGSYSAISKIAHHMK